MVLSMLLSLLVIMTSDELGAKADGTFAKGLRPEEAIRVGKGIFIYQSIVFTVYTELQYILIIVPCDSAH